MNACSFSYQRQLTLSAQRLRLAQKLEAAPNECVGHWQQMQLRSHFQPIISPTHRRTVGYEALLRASQNEQALSPLAAFARCETDEAIASMDLLCLLLHVFNFQRLQKQDAWLFVNVRNEQINTQNMRAGLMRRMLARHGLQPDNIVLEILEDAVSDPGLLADFVHHYREEGFLVAIDDFGAGQSNFDRIWRIEPNIVKLDRSMIANAAANPKQQRLLPKLVALLRETGALVLIEGIETQREALLALDSEADLLQGYYFARPSAQGSVSRELSTHIRDLHHISYQSQLAQLRRRSHKKALLRQSIEDACQSLQLSLDLSAATQSLLAHPAVKRIYLLNRHGVQIHETLSPHPSCQHRLEAAQTTSKTTLHYKPLRAAEGALWARRTYFRNALAQPGKVHFSQPYLGLPDADLDITISQGFMHEAQGQLVVLCVDINAAFLDD